MWSAMDRIFVILGYFLPFYLPDEQENPNFEKLKKIPGDIILYMSTINDNYMMYGSCDMEYVAQNFFSFWAIFCPLSP